jgi:diaminopimelate epimerase
MQGAGNDFVVFDNRSYKFSLEEIIAFTPKLCDRRYGIGADGLMVLQDNPYKTAAFEMIYRNADGSDAGMCGNGGRCMSLFASGLGFETHFDFHVHEVVYKAEVRKRKKEVTVHFPQTTTIEKRLYNNFAEYYQLYTGTDHIVLPIADPNRFKKDELFHLGKEMRYSDEINPKGTNVNFFSEFKDGKKDQVKLETYERGVEDFTLACGTGAIATALTYSFIHEKKDGKQKVVISCAGGDLKIDFEKKGDTFTKLSLSGPAEIVYKGEVLILL